MNYKFKSHPRIKNVSVLEHEDHWVLAFKTKEFSATPIQLFYTYYNRFLKPQPLDSTICCLQCGIPLPEHIITQIKLLLN